MSFNIFALFSNNRWLELAGWGHRVWCVSHLERVWLDESLADRSLVDSWLDWWWFYRILVWVCNRDVSLQAFLSWAASFTIAFHDDVVPLWVLLIVGVRVPMAVALNHIVPLRIFLVAIKVVSSVLMAVENLITVNSHLTILRLSKAISV